MTDTVPPSPSEPETSEAPGEPDRVLARTAIVVVAYGSTALLERNLTHVARQAPEARVVVVDNASTPQHRRELRALAEREGWLTVLPETNLGFGAGMNLGAEAASRAGASALVLLNPDARIDRQALRLLAARAQEHEDRLLAPVLTDSSGRVVSDGVVVCLADGSMRSRRSRRPVPPGGTRPWLSGACLALSTALFEAVGGFDARYFLYWEDVDLSARVQAAGGSLEVVRRAVAVHDEGGTQAAERSSSRALSDTYYYYNVRNRLLYAGLHLDGAQVRRWVLTAPAAAREIVLRGGRRQLLDSPRPVLTALVATRDGLRLLRQARAGRLPDDDVPLPR